MTGRNRRASTSSVETVDEDQIPWRQETSVLKSVAKDLPEDDWPTYELRDAVVLNKDGRTLESLLDVATRGPYTVRGTLIIDDPDQRRNLLIRVRKSVPIEVRVCIRFSIGESHHEGLPLIWAAGKAGWYELSPSVTYQRIYNKMCEANTMYYRILDIYKDTGIKKMKKTSKSALEKELAPLFHQYSAKVGDGSTLTEVFDRCREHVGFLKSHCFAMQFADEFAWESTPFYKWLAIEHEAMLKRLKECTKSSPRLSRSPVSPRPTQVTTQITTQITTQELPSLPSRTRQGSTVSSVTRSSPPRTQVKHFVATQRSSRSRSVTSHDTEMVPAGGRLVTPASKPAVTPASSAAPVAPTAGDVTPLQSVIDALEWTYGELSGKRRDLNMIAVLNHLYANYKFPNYKNGQVAPHRVPPMEVLHYNAAALLQTLDKNKYGPFELYAWLQEASTRPFDPLAIKDWPYPLVRRGSRPRPSKKLEVSQALDVGGSPMQEIDDEPWKDGTGLPAYSGKEPKRRGRPAGKKSILRLANTPRKRPHSDLDSASDLEVREAKRSHYFSDGDEAMEDVEDAEDASSPELTPDDDEELIKIVIRADKIPSSTPHGPHETWTCDQEDCDYVVRGGDEKECQERIQKHFREHETQVERVNLALTESRGQPINHLLEKLKKLGEKAQQKDQIMLDGVVLPQPIKRKLIV